MKPRILISEELHSDLIGELETSFEVVLIADAWSIPQRLASEINKCEILVVGPKTMVTWDLLKSSESIVAVVWFGDSTKNLDLSAIDRKNLVLVRLPNSSVVSVLKTVIPLKLMKSIMLAEMCKYMD